MFTIGNQIAVLPNGTLVDVFHYGKGSGRDQPNASLTGVARSTDGGTTWSKPIRISNNPVADDVDPDTGFPRAPAPTSAAACPTSRPTHEMATCTWSGRTAGSAAPTTTSRCRSRPTAG
jgi:hypothetical protein